MQVTIISYEESNDTFKCSIDGRIKHVDAAVVATSCDQTGFLDDLPYDLVGKVFDTYEPAFL